MDPWLALTVALGVGSGAMPFEYEWCGEEADHRVRGDMLDEGLELLEALWRAGPVHHRGRHYRVAGEGDPGSASWSGLMHPPPVQQPRIPVWVAATWPGGRPFRRAARWDGVLPMRADGRWDVADTDAVVAAVTSHGAGASRPFDVAVPGETRADDAGDAARVAAHEAAGATWWVEAVHPWRFGRG